MAASWSSRTAAAAAGVHRRDLLSDPEGGEHVNLLKFIASRVLGLGGEACDHRGVNLNDFLLNDVLIQDDVNGGLFYDLYSLNDLDSLNDLNNRLDRRGG